MDDTPVYCIKAMDNPKAPIRVLYRNMLHPAHLAYEDDNQPELESVQMTLSKANALMEAYFNA